MDALYLDSLTDVLTSNCLLDPICAFVRETVFVEDRATNALSKLQSYAADGAPTALISDELVATSPSQQKAAAGTSVKTYQRGPRPAVQAYTGTLDALWKCLKEQVPGSLRTRTKNKKVNPLLLHYTRQFQRQYVQQKRNLLKRTEQTMFAKMFK